MKKKDFRSFIIFLVILVALPLSLTLVKRVQNYLTEALGEPANIFVDTASAQNQISPVWQAIAQGGEEKADMLTPVLPQLRELNPKFIRLDHIYDFYNVVGRENGDLVYDWTQLDKTIDTILELGATPFFSLSYMPPAIAKNGGITDQPASWQEWQQVVQETVEHFSGRENKNLMGAYYEVWNEPDLFGHWMLGSPEKDYLLLYRYAVQGAQEAKNTNAFMFGGPATTGFYKNWFNNFLKYIDDNHLRLDFYSWHRYSMQPTDFLKDADQFDSLLTNYPNFSSLQKIITEWGSDSENSPNHDGQFDAAHLVAIYRQMLHRIDLAFVFEARDGVSPAGKEYWGRWGLLTHNGQKKPKFLALQLLNQVKGQRLKLNGEGSWVTGFATKNEDLVYLILANFDPRNTHFETVPVAFANLAPGKYLYEEVSLSGSPKKTEQQSTGILTEKVFMEPNGVTLVKLAKVD